MKILDSRRDYYDGFLMSHHSDPEDGIFWDRRETSETKKIFLSYYPTHPVFDGENPEKNPFGKIRYEIDRKDEKGKHIFYECMGLVGFCGRVYPYTFRWERTPTKAFRKVIGYEVDSKHPLYRDFEQFKNPPQRYLDYWINHMPMIWDAYRSGGKWGNQVEFTTNPHLESLGFASVFDVYQASQTVYQWLCNRKNPEKPMPELSNNDMIEVHGFNLKTSFRNNKPC